MSEYKNLGSSLVATLRSDEVVSIASDAAEMGIDAALTEGLLKDVPIISTLMSLTKVGLTIRDRLFVKKLLKFLHELKSIPSKERQGMVEKLEGDSGYGRNAGEHLIEILERLDAHRKPEMTAIVFAAYVAGRIDIKTFHRLNNAIDKLPFYEIDSVRQIHTLSEDGRLDDAKGIDYHALENAGLMHVLSGYGGLVYRPSDLCQVFVDLDLDRMGT